MDILTFLKNYRDWATSGAPEHECFVRGAGLCGNAQLAGGGKLCREVETLLKRDFGGDWYYPFGGADEYLQRLRDDTQPFNPLRLAWLDKIIGEMENG